MRAHSIFACGVRMGAPTCLLLLFVRKAYVDIDNGIHGLPSIHC